MVTRIGNRFVYDEFAMGCAASEENEGHVLLTFHDKDNDEIHMFDVASDQLDRYITLIQQTIAGTKIEVATTMPKGPHAA